MTSSTRARSRALAAAILGAVGACGDQGEMPTTTLGSASDASASESTADSGGSSEVDETSVPTEDSTSPESTEASDAESESMGGAGPMIVLLTATPPEITETDLVTVLAQVVDPDGAEDIVGGLLTNEAGDATYGAFMQISEGSFSVVLDWNTINAVEPITYEEDPVRTFVAEFTDTAANAATDTVEVRFDCGGLAVCDGECVQLGTPENCASCGDACRPEASCDGGQCGQPPGCGDGVTGPGEQCDGRDLQGFTCETLGLNGGVLGCDPTFCTFDTSNCF